MYTQISSCPKCGAPLYTPTHWNSIIPPPIHYSCNCYSVNVVNSNPYITTNTQPLSTQNLPNTNKAMDKLFEEFEDNDIVDSEPTNEKLLRRLRKLEDEVAELKELVLILKKDNEKIKHIKNILKD